MSIERRLMFRVYGADIVLTPKALGMPGAVKMAEKLVSIRIYGTIYMEAR
jgi:cysteine synthase